MTIKSKVVGEAKLGSKQVENVRPTLIIGLGGTGREILLRIRQRFVERYDVPRFPSTAFLWIDTDSGNREGVAGRAQDAISAQAQLAATEVVDATVNAEDFLSYFDHPRDNPHIFQWIYTGLRKSGSVLHGARAIRPLGRLAFFHHYKEIRHKVQLAVNEVTDARVRQRMSDEFDIDVTPQPFNVVMAFSVAGGTGSGMFLDAAFLLKHLSHLGEIPPVEIIGYLVMPSVYSSSVDESPRHYANAYAALKELEYFSMRKDQRFEAVGVEDVREVSAHDFRVDWDRSGERAIVGPPFHTCFLIDNAPLHGSAIPMDARGDLFDMIAENIFLDFMAEQFAGAKRSVRSNLEDYLKNDLEYTYADVAGEPLFQDVFSCRFSAFGFTKLYVPVDRIRRACGQRLALDVLDRWLTERPARGDLREHLKAQEVDELDLRGVDRRLSVVDDSGRPFEEAIRAEWTDRQRRRLHDEAAQRSPQLAEAMAGALTEYRRQKFDRGDDPRRWGEFLRRVELVNSKELKEHLEGRVRDRLHLWSRSPSVRLGLAIEYLKTLADMVRELGERYDKRAQARRELADDCLRDWNALVQVVREEESGGLWVHRWSLRALVTEATAVASEYFVESTAALVYETARDTLSEFASHLGTERTVQKDGRDTVVREGLVYELFELRERLTAMRAEAAARLAAYDRVEDHLVFVNLYQEGLFERFYRRPRAGADPVPITEQVLDDVEARLFGALDIASPYALGGVIGDRGENTVRTDIERFTVAEFKTLELRDAEALRLLDERERATGASTGPNESDAVARFVEKGLIWLSPGTRARSAGSGLAANHQGAVLLGMDLLRRDTELYREFEDAVRDLVQRRQNVIRSPLGAPVQTAASTVYLYSELAGFPLAFIDGLERYQQAYRKSIREPLHTDRRNDAFSSIVLKGEAEVEHAVRINRVILLGVIVRVLDVSPVEMSGTDSEMVISYVDRRAVPYRRTTIGTMLEAYETLSADPSLLQAIEDDIDERASRLTPELREQFLTILASHIADGETYGIGAHGPFATRRIRVGSQHAERTPIEQRAIREAIAEVVGHIADDRRIREARDASNEAHAIIQRWYPERMDFAEPIHVGAYELLGFRGDVLVSQARR